MNENVRVKRGEEFEVLTGDRLDAYQDIDDDLSLKQMKIARDTTKGLLNKKKFASTGRLYKSSKTDEGKVKYCAWLKDVEKLENEVIRWGLVIEKRKEDERNKKT